MHLATGNKAVEIIIQYSTTHYSYYCYYLRGGIVQGVPHITTISALLYFPYAF
jgi:hypothetical protein